MLLVTGASGLLGASVVLQARDSGRKVAGICHRHPLRVPGVELYEVDLTDRSAIQHVCREARPDSIVHCAAATNVDWCEDHPGEAEKINLEASANLAEISRQRNTRLTYISTDSVFDGKRGNYSETDQTCPLNVYARLKLRAEEEVLQHCPSALLVRTNIYGWNAQNKQSLAEWILGQLAAGERVPGFVDTYFCPLLANDLANLLLTMLDRGLSGLYHVVGAERISKYEFATKVAATFQFDPAQAVATHLSEARLRAARPQDVSLNTEKIQTALGQPMPNVDAGLQRFRALREQGYSQQLKSYLGGAAA